MGFANDFTIPENAAAFYTGKIDIVDHTNWRNTTRSYKPCKLAS